MASIKGIHHVAISIPPEHHIASIRFYRDVLGLEELESPESLVNVPVIAWFRLGENELHLIEEPKGTERRRRHFCIEVDDLAAFRDRLTRSGEETQDADPIPGRPRFFCYDPAGNRIELLVDESHTN